MEVAITAAGALAGGLFLWLAYRQGLKDGCRLLRGQGLERPLSRRRKKEAREQDIIRRNIERYQGSGAGQQEVTP